MKIQFSSLTISVTNPQLLSQYFHFISAFSQGFFPLSPSISQWIRDTGQLQHEATAQALHHRAGAQDRRGDLFVGHRTMHLRGCHPSGSRGGPRRNPFFHWTMPPKITAKRMVNPWNSAKWRVIGFVTIGVGFYMILPYFTRFYHFQGCCYGFFLE